MKFLRLVSYSLTVLTISFHLTASSFYVGPAVKFPVLDNNPPAGTRARFSCCVILVDRSSHHPWPSPRQIASIALAASTHVGRPCASNELLCVLVPFTSHQMPISLFSDPGSSLVSAPSERRFFTSNPLEARATHTSQTIHRDVLG